MSETKRVRNNSGADIAVEYGGSHYHFAAGVEREIPADLADVAQYRHGHQGLLIVFAGDTTSPAPPERQRTVTVQVLHQEVAPEPPPSFRCPEGDFAGNDKADYDAHLASAHGLSEPKPDPTSAESPSTDATPAAPSAPRKPRKEKK